MVRPPPRTRPAEDLAAVAPILSRDELRAAVVEGIQVWLDRQFLRLGKWGFGALLSAALAGLVWLATHGGTFRQ